MNKHSISTGILILLIGVVAIAIIASGFEIGDTSECPSGTVAFTNGDKWTCGVIDPSAFNVNYTYNNYNYTYIDINESDPVWNSVKANYALHQNVLDNTTANQAYTDSRIISNQEDNNLSMRGWVNDNYPTRSESCLQGGNCIIANATFVNSNIVNQTATMISANQSIVASYLQAGSIPFINEAKNLSDDNSNLYYDYTQHRIIAKNIAGENITINTSMVFFSQENKGGATVKTSSNSNDACFIFQNSGAAYTGALCRTNTGANTAAMVLYQGLSAEKANLTETVRFDKGGIITGNISKQMNNPSQPNVTRFNTGGRLPSGTYCYKVGDIDITGSETNASPESNCVTISATGYINTTDAYLADGEGVISQWSASGCTNKQDCVSTDDGDTSYLYASACGYIQLLNFSNELTETDTINWIKLKAVAKSTGSSSSFKLIARDGSSYTISPTLTTVTTGYQNYFLNMTTKPSGGSWTWAAVSGNEFET